jgi:GNAT superfamily N-acetyltransferase
VRAELDPDGRVDLEDAKYFRAHLAEHYDVIAWEGDDLVGAATALVSTSFPRPFGRNYVLPRAQRRGIGTALYRAVSRWAAERGHNEFEIWIEDDHPEGREFAEKRGYREIGREDRLILELASTAPVGREPPDGIEIVTWAEHPKLIEGVYGVARESYPDVPGEEDVELPSFDDWLAKDMSGPGDRPEAVFIALAGDEVVGYSKFSLTKAQPETAHHDMTGVKRAWRRRGIAGALKAAQIRWAKEAGYTRLVTRNERRNTAIQELNQRFGYRPAPGQTLMRGPLAD